MRIKSQIRLDGLDCNTETKHLFSVASLHGLAHKERLWFPTAEQPQKQKLALGHGKPLTVFIVGPFRSKMLYTRAPTQHGITAQAYRHAEQATACKATQASDKGPHRAAQRRDSSSGGHPIIVPRGTWKQSVAPTLHTTERRNTASTTVLRHSSHDGGLTVVRWASDLSQPAA